MIPTALKIQARYTAKWRRKDGELVLKVTDDETVGIKHFKLHD